MAIANQQGLLMGLLKHQKELQKRFYQPQPAANQDGQTAPAEKTAAPKPAGAIPQGPIAVKSKVDLVNQLVETDMASYKGLPIEEKRTIKAFLLRKYHSELEWILLSQPKEFSLLLNAVVIWLYDLGEIEQFLNVIDQAIAMKQNQTLLPQKSYQLMKLYWIVDWAYQEREQGRPFEPYFSQVFQSISDWNQPKRIKEGYWYLMFYSLLNQGKLKEAMDLGPKALEHGAGIKTNLSILEGILAGTIQKQWDATQQAFI
jgi:hypothetical protein